MSPQLSRRDVLRIGAGAAGAAASSALLSACGLGGDAGTPSGADRELVFLSTQLATTEEAELLRRRILAGSDQKATLVPASSSTQFIDRVVAESKAGATNVGVLGGLQGEFATLAAQGLLRDMGDVVGELADRKFTQKYLDLAKV